MISGEIEEPLRARIVAALGRLGLESREVVALSPPEATKRGRSTWRAELESGETVKARLLESAAEARRLLAVRDGLEQAFAPPIASDGSVLVEQWIAGRPLTAPEADARAQECGALLGRLHLRGRELTPAGSSLDAAPEQQALDDLHALGEAALLDPREVEHVAQVLLALAPRRGDRTFAHEDFCPSNMILDRQGRLRIIDNEWFGLRPAGFDLGRTFVRWPMTVAAWSRFLQGYRSSGGAEPDALLFWQIAAALWTARLRLAQPERLGEPLALVRRLVPAAARGSRSSMKAHRPRYST